MSRFTLKNRLGRVAASLTIGAALIAPQAATQVMAQEMAGPNTGNVSLTLGLDVVSQYYFRGFVQQDSGVIVQPYVDVAFSLLSDGEGAIGSVDLYGGAWNSFHGDKTSSVAGAATTSGNLYETDYYFGVAVGLLENWTVDLSYVAYTYDTGPGSTIEEIDVAISYDDSELFDGIPALNPYALFAFEIAQSGGTEDSYLELGIEPSFTIVESEDQPITLSIPVALGISLDDYYVDSTGSDETIGFLSIGAIFSTPLNFIPSEFGSWEATAGLVALLLNDDHVGFDDNGEDFQVIATFGLSMSY